MLPWFNTFFDFTISFSLTLVGSTIKDSSKRSENKWKQ